MYEPVVFYKNLHIAYVFLFGKEFSLWPLKSLPTTGFVSSRSISSLAVCQLIYIVYTSFVLENDVQIHTCIIF